MKTGIEKLSIMLVLLLTAATGAAQVITRVSEATAGGAGNGDSRLMVSRWAINSDGRYVAFESDATDLVADDTNGVTDVFVRDVELGTTTRVSVDVNGEDADGPSEDPSISADGRYVAFRSAASDLVEGDGNGVGDVFVRDLHRGATIRISVDTEGGDADGESNTQSISADGRVVAFSSHATDLINGDG
ncbi:MAG: PD40 domain-containing protein, partial [Acidobacteria bacterium]|nr:PD40 domain-containing protein [Acidobacteriota bacterium]